VRSIGKSCWPVVETINNQVKVAWFDCDDGVTQATRMRALTPIAGDCGAGDEWRHGGCWCGGKLKAIRGVG
jgi:hypothetical protein